MEIRFDPRKSEKAKEELQSKVLSLAENFKQDPQEMFEYLAWSTRFYNYSTRNTMLIFSQNSGAKFCNSYKTYSDMGYQVKRGEHGMKILVPVEKTFLNINDELIPLSLATKEQIKLYKEHKIKTTKKLFYKIGTVFDIAQTDCPKSDYPKYLDLGYSSEQHLQLYKVLKNYAEEKLHCTVNENAFSSVTLRGYFDPTNNIISLSGSFDDTTKLSIFSHELAHAMLHNNIKTKVPEAQIEFEADATSAMLLSYFGIEIPSSRKDHLSSCYQNLLSNSKITDKDIMGSLSKAQEAYYKVIKTVNEQVSKVNGMSNYDEKATDPTEAMRHRDTDGDGVCDYIDSNGYTKQNDQYQYCEISSDEYAKLKETGFDLNQKCKSSPTKADCFILKCNAAERSQVDDILKPALNKAIKH